MPAVISPEKPSPGGVVIPPANEEIFKAQERLFVSAYDQARSYAHIVLGLGYVGIFASWSFTKELLTPGQVFWSALLGSLSLFVYILYEVYSMFVTSLSLLAMQQAVSKPHEFSRIIAENEQNQMRRQKSDARVWIICWVFCVLTGVGSGLILLGAFVGHLFLN